MRAEFLIKAKEANIITEKGVRAFVMEKLLNSPFEKGFVANLDGRTVQVRIEGDEKEIMEFKQRLEMELVAKLGNPEIAFSDISQTTARMPNLLKSSQALMVGQLEKGITVQLDILGTLKSLGSELRGLRGDLVTALKK